MLFPMSITVTINTPEQLQAFMAASVCAKPSPTFDPNSDHTQAIPREVIDKAKDLTMKIVAAKGRDEAVKLLQKYGVPVAAKLPADQVAAFCTDAEAVLAS